MLGEILDASVRLYKKRVCSLIVAQLPLTLFYIGYNAFCYIVEPHTFTLFSIYGNSFYDLLMGFFFDDDLNFFRVSFLPALLYVTAVYPVTLSAVTKIASDSIVTVPSSVRRAYTFSLKHWWKLGVINIMITLALGALIYLLLTIMFPLLSVIATSRYYNDILFFSVFLAGLLPAFFLWARLAAVYPIMIHEKEFSNALRRSWHLVGGYTVQVLFALFVVFLIPFGVMGFSYIVDGLLKTSSEPLLASLLLISGTAAHGLFLPLVGCTRVGIYVTLRRRKEGYDLEQRTMQL